jgi:TldD protein
VRQVSASISGEWQTVAILRRDGQLAADVRPLVRLNVSVVVGEGDRMESGSSGTGGRTGYAAYVDPSRWRAQSDEALRQALVNLSAVDAPAGEMTFSGLMGSRVAAPGVTVVDDGTIENRRGSLTIDDEGTPTQRTVLIEDGVLVGFMQDRMNARLMGMRPTGNGRRESFAHRPLPRMTNTCMLAGSQDPKEILGSVKNGLYAVNFGGGQVDITSGKFVFSASEAYRIENGRIGAAVKGATLIGNGPDVLTKVRMIGNDMRLDPGVGTCGKDGQGVPVGVGQPTLLVEGLTVGGTAA